MTNNKRHKAALPDFYSTLKSGNKYTDKDFSADVTSIYWSGFGE